MRTPKNIAITLDNDTTLKLGEGNPPVTRIIAHDEGVAVHAGERGVFLPWHRVSYMRFEA